MRKTEIMMSTFIAGVIIAGCFGPYLISIALTATAALLYVSRGNKSPHVR